MNIKKILLAVGIAVVMPISMFISILLPLCSGVIIIDEIITSKIPYSYGQIIDKGTGGDFPAYDVETFDKNGKPAGDGEVGGEDKNGIPVGTWLKMKTHGPEVSPSYVTRIPESEVPAPAIKANKQFQKELKEE